MDKNEVIILSSDEEEEFTKKSQLPMKRFLEVSCETSSDKKIPKIHPDTVISSSKTILNIQRKDSHSQNHSKMFIKCYEKKKKEIVESTEKPPQILIKEVFTHRSPEVVDLVDCREVSPENIVVCSENSKKKEDHIKPFAINTICSDIVDKEKSEKQQAVNCSIDKGFKENSLNLNQIKNSTDIGIEYNKTNIIDDKETVAKFEANKTGNDSKNMSMITKRESTDTAFYDEFVNFCASLERNPTDKARLLKKLYKRFEEANPKYIESSQFKNLIKKCINKLNSNNLYLVAKEVTDELCTRKKIEMQAVKFNGDAKNNQRKDNEIDQEKCERKMKKQSKIINKILRKLDLLGKKIREIEDTEVDLSDEEESSYIQLQRYRYRFCLIYKKLCEYTNEISDANRVYSRKITFSGSKYLEINKCIEKWLNKTKRFPDFTDIIKLLESQGSSLGLPSNQESLRAIAIEIFQQVGVMLQQRRKYDLWDSFCGFLNESEDPANNDPELEKILKQNFENRVKKEQEIIAHFAELQEKERLKPEEVPEEEAYISPVESGNEDEEELEKIEKTINEKLDVFIEEEQFLNDTRRNGKNLEKSCENECINTSEEAESTDTSRVESSISLKESKNNYKNCKSLKWREGQRTEGKCIDDKTNAPHLKTHEMDVVDEIVEEKKKNKIKVEDLQNESRKTDDDDSDVEFISLEPSKKTGEKIIASTPSKTSKIQPKRILDSSPSEIKKSPLESVTKEDLNSEGKPPSPKKFKSLTSIAHKEFESNCTENSRECKKSESVFQVRFCEVKFNLENLFDKFDYDDYLDGKKKNGVRGKVFRDLTNIGQLLKPSRTKKKLTGFFTPTFYHRGIVQDIEKSTWKKRFRVNYRFASSREQRCALSHEEKKTGKNVRGEEKNSNEKSVENDSGGGLNQGREGFCGGCGNGREDNNGNDENKKNGNAKDDVEESKMDEEEEKDEDNEDERSGESSRIELSENASLRPKEDVNEPPPESDFLLIHQNDEKLETRTLNEPKGEKKESVVPEENQNFFKSNEGLITAEATVGEKVVEAEVILEENMDNLKSTRFQRRLQRKRVEVGYGGGSKSSTEEIEVIEQKVRRRNSSIQYTEPSDEERVKKFLLNSPSSISITPPKNLSLSKPPSQAALQALATLRGLKGISTTRVRRKRMAEDDVMVISESNRKIKNSTIASHQIQRDVDSTNESQKRGRSHLPVITNVQSMKPTIPKIVTVQGNMEGFENVSRMNRNEESVSNCSTIKISNVWGSFHNNFAQNDADTVPSCSFPQDNGDCQSGSKKKNLKKSVEYVVLD